MSKLIVGCGYLGWPVGQLWLAQNGPVHAMTRKSARADEFSQAGFQPVIGDITQPDTLVDIPEVDTLLVAVGMDRSVYSDVEQVYVGGLKNMLDRLTFAPRHLVYVSSTGVYGDFDGGWVDETSMTQPQRPGGHACLKAEQLLRQSRFAERVTILRFAGIYGEGRVPTRQKIESGQWQKLASGGFLNLIHVADGAAIIERVAAKSPQGETYIVSDGRPVKRREYYQYMAQRLGLDEMPFADSLEDHLVGRGGSSKRVSNQKLLDWIGAFEFKYPDYRAGLDQAMP